MRSGLSAFAGSLIAFSVLPVYAAGGDVAITTIDYAKWIDLVSKVLLGLASVAVAILAYQAWRTQFVLTKRYELARKVLLQVFQVSESISIVRGSPVHPITGRLSDVLDEKVEAETKETRFKEHRRVYEQRWAVAWGWGQVDANAAFSQRLSELALARSEVAVVLGTNQAQKIEAVETCIRKLASAYGEYFPLAKRYIFFDHPVGPGVGTMILYRGYELPFSKDQARERIKASARVLHPPSKDEEDVFGKELDSALRNAQESFREVLRLQG
jgi:hypothetical protein